MGLVFDSIVNDLLLVLVTLVISVYLYFKYSFTYWERKGVPHLPPSFPFGNFNSKFFFCTGHIVRDICDKLKQTGAKYGGLYMLKTPMFLPLDPELIKCILLKEFSSFTDRGMFCDEEVDLMTANIICYGGEKWRQSRLQVNSTLTSSKLKTMFPSICKCQEEFQNILAKLSQTSQPLNIKETSERYVMDVIASSSFGVEGNCLTDPNSDFYKNACLLIGDSFAGTVRFVTGVLAPWFLKLFKIALFDPKASRFFYKVVEETIDFRDKNNITRMDYMQSLLKIRDAGALTGRSWNLDQIAAQAFMNFFAGFETSAFTLALTMYELCENLHIQDKLRDEVRAVLRKYDGELTYDGVMEMTYLHKVVSETLRKHPPVTSLDRDCTQDFRVPGSDVVIKKGTHVIISILALHGDAEYYPEPLKYDPKRFSEEEIAKRPPFTFLPFGDGPRICLGMRYGYLQVKTGLISLLKDYKFTLHSKTKTPIELLSKANLMKMKEELWLNVEKC